MRSSLNNIEDDPALISKKWPLLRLPQKVLGYLNQFLTMDGSEVIYCKCIYYRGGLIITPSLKSLNPR